MLVLFPSNPIKPTTVDPAFEAEFQAAHDLGIDYALVDVDTLGNGLVCTFKHLTDRAPGQGFTVVYRGWILTNPQYETLYRVLWGKGHRMVNTPAEYRFCQELPQWYGELAGVTPKSMWFKPNRDGDFELDGVILDVSRQLGDGPYIVKDFVKSRKHEWDTACFIPDIRKLVEVTEAFLEGQGDDLAGGLVFRQYVPFRMVGEHPKSKMPLCNEVRTLSLGSRTISKFPYWGPDEGGSAITMPPGIVTFRSTDPKARGARRARAQGSDAGK